MERAVRTELLELSKYAVNNDHVDKIKTYEKIQTGIDVALLASQAVITPVVTNQVYKAISQRTDNVALQLIGSCGAGMLTYMSLELLRRKGISVFDNKIDGSISKMNETMYHMQFGYPSNPMEGNPPIVMSEDDIAMEKAVDQFNDDLELK